MRELEADLAQYTDQDGEYPHSHDDMVFPGGIVRLDQTDEMPRYLGPSSGTAMTRLLMEEAKRYGESRRIANLIPAVLARRAERRDRMQSVVMGSSISGPAGRTRSYPAHSIIPASALPSREIVDGLVRAFNDRGGNFPTSLLCLYVLTLGNSVQVLTPILHEKAFEEDLNAVFAGDTDPYKHFVVNMVVAISLQKMGKYAGLPDSYYLNAMRRFEDVVRPQDLKTLQCLVLIGQYSLMTPTRTATYYVTGLATRICQQMGLGDESTIAVGLFDARALDMRRRVSWVVTTQEFGLAYTMGRPTGFAKADDFMNVKFFDTAMDEDITPDGIRPGRPCERKEVAIHFCKMRLLQAEIRRVLYEKKRSEPVHESHPWFLQMEQRLKEWLDTCPEQPAWCKPWYESPLLLCVCERAANYDSRLAECHHSMIISLYRPSPQVPKPTSNAALKCFEASRSIIDLTSRQIEDGTADITWESLLTIYASLNALLWSISYLEVRTEHVREDVQDLAAAALEAIKIFSDRWPGSSSAVQLYTVIANACLQSYNVEEETPSPPSTSQLGTPVSLAGPISPESDGSRNTPTRQAQPQSATSIFNTSSPFGYLFDAANDALAAQYGFDNDTPPFQHQPTFRSNSIFMSPSTDGNGRRLSHLAPDSSEAAGPERLGNTPPPPLIIPKQEPMPPTTTSTFNSLPTPPESLVPPPAHPMIGLSPRLTATTAQTTPIQTPHLHPASPAPGPQHHPSPIPQAKQQPMALFAAPHFKQEHQQQTRPPPPPTFITPPPPSHSHPQQATQQRPPQPPTAADWYNPLPQFVPPNAFTNGMNNPSFWTGTPNPFHGPGVPSGQQQQHGAYPGARNGLHQAARGNPETNWNLGWGAGPHHEVGGGFPSPGFGPGLAPPMAGGAGGEYYNSFISLRNGSLSQEQQMELMDVLETEGMSDIEGFLNLGGGIGGQHGQGHGHGGHVHWG